MNDFKILIVDDELEITELISLYLRREGYHVFVADNGYTALQMVKEVAPDLIILDILLKSLDGIEVCKEIRKTSNVPILFVSCKSDDVDIIMGLTVGGDDYITKPFSPSQLVARVKAHLRRTSLSSRNYPIPLQHKITFGALEIDLHSHNVIVEGKSVALSAKEFDLLAYLAQSPNKVFKLEQLYQHIWNTESFGDTRTLMVHISNLRKKIEPDPTQPRYIVTVRGVGYKFQADSY
ncbi:response regulator transcription factor [Paenibacillus apiarius]|uniref:Response regulator transcription factor n=2 Tax=Paenibacillus TaxID=44249 RepID=A0ABT4DVI2_9BACL|nr:response regulator transcription factor [Paenibacillus apiarius]MCY9515860.1 response regulator transcription factor [Paenibacillus apiarius]MCY9520770.1 response regulator transcription factor [Paenibacillus apiarius]MCY9553474.1 response regulator transcription factor [Paenibacillus apiarius]MCY9558002.1 response regulator transcription factor [Paenibacillus apiarius]MCY9685857.1 response regulator transcription factor [Paenibacillus apiarius]